MEHHQGYDTWTICLKALKDSVQEKSSRLRDGPKRKNAVGRANQYKKDDEKRAPARQRTMVPHGTRSSCVALQNLQHVGLYHIELAWSESADNLAGFASVSQSTF